MISVNQRTLRDLVEQGIQRAKNADSSLLVTHVERITKIDPLTFFENGQLSYGGKRFYWSNPEELTLVGGGIAVSFEGQGTDRMRQIKKQWMALLERTIGLTKEKITGPIMLGGLSFDPTDQKASHWEAFPEAGFFVPEVLLTIKGETFFLTLNIWVNRKTEADKIEQHYEQVIENLLSKRKEKHTTSNGINAIQDIKVDAWLKGVEQATRQITEGKLSKVVLSREVKVTGKHAFNLSAILTKLSHDQKNSYIFAFERGEKCFLGASPERLIERRGNHLLTGALAGTVGRGQTEEEDRKLGAGLLRSQKNREEHQFVVQMIQEAMEQFSDELEIPKIPELLKVRDVQHLYTPITGKAKNGATLLEIVEQLHPTPALGGQPRTKAMQLIRELETYNRGWYAAPIGWMDAEGEGEFAVAIRSALIEKSIAHLYAGCGVVEASDPYEELEETHLKLRPMLAALEGSEEE